jgi:octaprenyl-diphosphate synthase
MSSKVTHLPSSRPAARNGDVPAMSLEDIRGLVRPDLAAVDALIRARLKSSVPLVDQVAEHIIGGGGKRLRPLLCVLAGPRLRHRDRQAHRPPRYHRVRAYRHAVARRRGRRLQKRRGRATANNIFGNQASVLVGDFVYSRAFQMMAVVGSQRVMEIMADATNVIAEGEVLQLMNAHDPETTEQRYLEVIYRKTGRCSKPAPRWRRCSRARPSRSRRRWHATANIWGPPTS